MTTWHGTTPSRRDHVARRTAYAILKTYRHLLGGLTTDVGHAAWVKRVADVDRVHADGTSVEHLGSNRMRVFKRVWWP